VEAARSVNAFKIVTAKFAGNTDVLCYSSQQFSQALIDDVLRVRLDIESTEKL